MNVIDKIVTEWAFRCKKGYPDISNLEDKKVLEKIMKEWNLEEQEAGESFNERIQSLSKKLQEKVREVYNTLSDSTKDEINNHIGAATIQEFKTNLTKLSSIFAPFFSIKADGVGRGELLPLLAIKGSTAKGTADKDINVEGIVIEVKELDATGKFRTGKSGSIKDTKLDERIQTLIKIVRNLADIPEVKKEIDKVLKYYEDTYITGSGKPGFFIVNIKNLIDKLQTIENNPQEYVKFKGERYSFTLKDNNTVVLGAKLNDTEVALWKIKKHEYYEDIHRLVADFTEVKEKYLDTIHYLLLYKNDSPEEVTLLSRDEAKDKVEVYDINQNNIRLSYGKPSRIKF